MGISWKGIVIVALLLLPNILFAVLPSKNMPTNLENGGLLINILESGSRILYFAAIILTTKNCNVSYKSIFFIGMIICLLGYYFHWARYFMNGRDFNVLMDNVTFIPMPMAVYPILFLLFAALWLKNTPLIILAGLFAVGHITNSYIAFK